MLWEHTESNPAAKEGPSVKGILPLEGDLHLLRRHLALKRRQLVIVAAKYHTFSSERECNSSQYMSVYVHDLEKQGTIVYNNASFSVVPIWKNKANIHKTIYLLIEQNVKSFLDSSIILYVDHMLKYTNKGISKRDNL